MKLQSYNEWDPLKEVIVGNAFNYNFKEFDNSLKLFFKQCNYMHLDRVTAGGYPLIKYEYIEELNEDVEGIVKVFNDLGIKVHRPKSLTKTYPLRTPYWISYMMPALNVRDQAIVFGDTLVETPPMVRCRYIENDLMKHIFYEAFQNGSNWLVMPRPIITDNSYDLSNVDSSNFKIESTPFDIGIEMLIDAAQFVRCNEDIIVNVQDENNKLAVDWIERHFPQLNFHRIYLKDDNHLDSFIVPLKEGVFLLRDKRCFDLLPDKFKKWKCIYPPEVNDNIFPEYDYSDILLASKYVDINILSIDGDKIMVNSYFEDLVRLLDKEGFTPIPVQHRHRRLVSGGFHCFTLDLVRG